MDSYSLTVISEAWMARVTQEHVDARRDAILDAAARLFARRGVSSATMAEIAAEADLSAGAIYRYFRSKDELMRAVFDEMVSQNQLAFEQETAEAHSPFLALQRVGRRVWIDLKDRDALICEVQMALTAAREPDDFGPIMHRNREAIRELLAEMVRAAQEAGEIDPNVEPDVLAVILQATTTGIQMLKLEERDDINIEAAFDLMIRMINGLSSGPSNSHER